jgi:hypothetical protein
MKSYREVDFDEHPKSVIRLHGKSWMIDQSIEEIGLTKKEFEEVVIPKTEGKISFLVIPKHRFSRNYETIILPHKNITLHKLLTIIYNFYNKHSMTLQELYSLNSSDVYDYIYDAIQTLKEDPVTNKVFPIDIMGDKHIFENIMYEENKIGDIQYTLNLGS